MNNERDVFKDPLIVLSLSLTFGVYLTLGFFIMTFYTSITLLVFLCLIYVSIFKQHITKKPHKINNKFLVHPAITLFILMPLAFALVLLFSPNKPNEIQIHYPLHLLLTYSYGITLHFLIVFVPMALLSKIKQNKNDLYDYSKKDGYHPSLSIIIPAYNEEKVIERTIRSVLESKYPKKQIIIIDNASTDNTRKILEKYSDKIKIVKEPKKGKAYAINSGIRVSNSEIIIVMDADTIVTKDAFQNIVIPFYKNPKMGGVSGNVKIINPNSNFHTKMQLLEYALASQISKAAQDTQNAVAIVSGAFGAFRKKAIAETRAFSNDTLTEDLDATVTILKNGYNTTIKNDAIAYTEAPESFSDLVKQRVRWSRGMLQGHGKHPDMLQSVAFGDMPSLAYFLLFNSPVFFPIISLINMVSIVPTLISGFGGVGLPILFLSMVITCGVLTLALKLNGDSLKYLWYFPFAFVYLRVHDFIFAKALLEHIFKKKANWNHLHRIGGKSDVV